MKATTLALSLSLFGCIDDGSPPELGETEAAVSIAGHYTWHGTSPTNLGLLSQQTCWLSGLGGDFSGQAYQAQPPSGFPEASIKARVRVFPNNATGYWQIDTDSGTGTGVQAQVQCVNVPYTSPGIIHEISWQDNLGTTGSEYDGTLNTKCYLRSVWATTGLSSMNSPNAPVIKLTRTVVGSSAHWDLDQSWVNHVWGDGDYAGAVAVCIDFPIESGHWNFTFSNTTVTLRDSYPSGNRVPTSDVACGITGISGPWTGGGYNYGGYLDGTGTYWQASVDQNRTIDINCVE